MKTLCERASELYARKYKRGTLKKLTRDEDARAYFDCWKQAVREQERDRK